jgi:hypothetical protein
MEVVEPMPKMPEKMKNEWPMDKPLDELEIFHRKLASGYFVNTSLIAISTVDYLLTRLKKAESERDGQAWACYMLWNMPEGGESDSDKAEYKKAMQVMSRGWNWRNEPKEEK